MTRNLNVIVYICQCRNNENEGCVNTTGEALGFQNKASRRMLSPLLIDTGQRRMDVPLQCLPNFWCHSCVLGGTVGLPVYFGRSSEAC